MRYTREVSDALEAGRPVVALESTLIAHGLPRPENLEIARGIEDVVREEGAVPATIAVIDGMVRIGLDEPALEAIAMGDDVAKCSARDLAVVMARRATGATTVAATATLAVRAGIGVFATGGIGGVHREARESWDESADLATLGQTPITVVCAGVKSILDVEATLERLETLNVTLLGYRTDRFPGFYLADSGFPSRGASRRRRRSPTSRTRAPSSASARSSWPTRSRIRSTGTCTSASCAAGSQRRPSRACAART